MKKPPPKLARETPSDRRLSDRWAVVCILLVTLPWWLAVTCNFLVIDDETYVTANPMVLGGLKPAAVAWAFTTAHGGLWIPLTWLSLMLDASCFGTGPVGFHATNVVLHVANALLVYFFFRRATGAPGRSLVAALLFAMHPLRVESVAWVTERKDVLFAFFGLWALLAYLWYARGGGWRAYALMLVAYACSLMSKSMLVTLPVLLLLLDLWPLDRWRTVPVRRLILEKLPPAALAAACAVVTILTQSGDEAIMTRGEFGPALRLENAVVSLALYLRDTVYFGGLSVYYPLPHQIADTDLGLSLAALLAVSGLAAFAAWRWRRAALPAAIGWVWFVVALLPVIGFLQAGAQSRADRFTYFPAIALTAGVVWLWPSAWLTGAAALRSRLAAVAATLALAVYMTLQLSLWRDPLTLFLDGIEHTKHQGPAFLEFCAGRQLQIEGNLDKARQYYGMALKDAPNFPEAANNAGTIFLQQGQLEQARQFFEMALQIAPNNPTYQHNMQAVRNAMERAGMSQPRPNP